MQNYKVFINNGLIFFGKKTDFAPENLLWSDFQKISMDELPTIVQSIRNNGFHQFILAEEEPEKAFQIFISYFEILEAAGGIVVNNKGDILMIHRFERWDFPKGHLHAGELASQGALREVMEETGIKNLKITHNLPTTWHMYSFANEWVVKKTHWYLMRSNYEGVLKPQLEEGILAAVWVPQYTLPEYMSHSYGTLRDLVDYINIHQLFDEY